MPAINWAAKRAKTCRKDAGLFIKLNISVAHFAGGFCMPAYKHTAITETYFFNQSTIPISFVSHFHFIQIGRITRLQDMFSIGHR